MPEISEERLKELEQAAQERESLLSTKARLEEENSKIKGRAKTAEEMLAEREKAELEEKGKTNELLELERKRAKELEEKLKNNAKATLREKTLNELTKHANDAHDVSMLLQVTEHRDLLKIDEENLTVEGAKEFVDKLREEKPYLFGAKRMPDTNNEKGDMGGTPPNDRSAEEINADYIKELNAANTSEQLAAVKKKFGKNVDNTF